jgi:hypothetical protein
MMATISKATRHPLWTNWVLAVAVLLVIALCGRVGGAIAANATLNAQFHVSAAPSQYANGVPLQTMDFTEYTTCFPTGIALIAHNYEKTVVNPIDLRYYTTPDERSAVALELPRGTELIAIPTDETYQFWTTGYGYLAYPTYSAGWRYAKPFLRVGQGGDFNSLPSYFVRTSDLEAIARNVIAVNKAFQVDAQQKVWTRQKYATEMVRFIDRLLYKSGVYSSPDLELPVFDLWDALLAGLLVVAGAAYLLTIRSRRRT